MADTIPTPTDLESMSDSQVLARAVEFFRDDIDGEPDQVEAAVLALMHAGAVAAATGEAAVHSAVTAALAQVARAMFREELTAAAVKDRP